VTGIDVDNRQPSMRQADRTVDEQAGSVWTAMSHFVTHRHQTVFVDAIARVKGNDAGYSTHGDFS
jgi:hypothetical protein